MYSRNDLNTIHNRLVCQRQHVLFTQWAAIVTNRSFCLSRITNEWISNAWLPLYAFRSADCGGDSADVRLRELRKYHNVPYVTSIINGKIHPYRIHHWKSQIGRITWIYRLDLRPEDINWDHLLKTWPNWKFQKVTLF